MEKEKFDKLKKPFDYSDVKSRIQWNNNETGLVVLYIDRRAVQERLDEVLGPNNWKVEFRSWHTGTYTRNVGSKMQTVEVPSQVCGLSVWDDERKEWVTKWDGAEDTENEAIKGGISDAMKRAAVQWGVGRYLLSMPAIWVDVELDKKERPKIKNPEKLEVEYLNFLGQCLNGDKQPTPASDRKNSPNMQKAPLEYDYTVSAVKHTDKNLYLTLLKKNDKKPITAYLQGHNAEIVPGVCLVDVTLLPRSNGGVAFNIIDNYKIVA